MPSPLGVTASTYQYPTVTGGTLYSDATYYYRVFTANGNLTVNPGSNADLSVTVLVVAGGGGGGT